MNKPKISICIPAYNTDEKLLRRAIEKILEQTLSDFELIIVNDGSTNNVKEVILSYNDPRIRYFENEKSHGGPAKARNIAISNAIGEYIFFHDHDDYLYIKTALEIMYFSAKQLDIDMLIFETVCSKLINGEKREEFGDFITRGLKKMEFFDHKNDEFLALISRSGVFPLWNKLLKVQFLKDNNIYFNENLKWLDDLEIFYKFIFHAKKIKAINACLYCWDRIENNSLITGRFNLCDLQAYTLIRSYLKDFGIYKKIKSGFLKRKLSMYNCFLKYTFPEDLDEYKNLIKLDLREDDLSPEEIAALHPWEKDTLKFFI